MSTQASAPLPRLDPLLAEPTRVRYGVLGYLCSLSFVLYIDRVCIGQAADAIEKDLHLSHTQMGFVFGAFTVAYGLFEVPTGRLGDRHGSRGVLTRIVLWWSLFTALTGCVWDFTLDSGYALFFPGWGYALPLVLNGFVVMLVVRFLFGAGEAGALPNAARVIARWFPPGGQGPAQGLINTAQLVGGAVAPVLAAYLIGFCGWRLAFVAFGSLGVIWAAAFYAWFRDDPAAHPAVNEAERRLIARGRPEGLPGPHPPVPWRRVLARPTVWLMGGAISCSAFVSYMYFFWFPSYLKNGRGLGETRSSWLSALVLAGGAVGSVVGGYLSDWLVRRTGEYRWTRRLTGFTGLGLASLLLLAGVQCDTPELTAALMALACCSAFATLASWWAIVTAISGKHVGVLFGLMNSLGVPGAMAGQVFFGLFVDYRAQLGYLGRDRWDPGFTVYAGALMIGAVAWLFIDATRSVVDPSPSDRSPV